jgi:hypothetical protein
MAATIKNMTRVLTNYKNSYSGFFFLKRFMRVKVNIAFAGAGVEREV